MYPTSCTERALRILKRVVGIEPLFRFGEARRQAALAKPLATPGGRGPRSRELRYRLPGAGVLGVLLGNAGGLM